MDVPVPQVLPGHPPGFTPVRRREDVADPGRSPYANHASWNAARCNRLLRPLTIKLTALKKVLPVGKGPDGKELPTASAAATSTQQTRTRGGGEQLGKDGNGFKWDELGKGDMDEDSDWAPKRVLGKRTKKKYSARGGGRDGGQRRALRNKADQGVLNADFVPGSIIVGTPIFSRYQAGTSKTDDTAPQQPRDTRVWQQEPVVENFGVPAAERVNRWALKPPQPETHSMAMRPLSRILPFYLMNIYDGLTTCLEVILRTTRPVRPPSSIGARSLFSTCLRQMPEYIKLEQQILDEEDSEDEERQPAVNDRDVASELFAELEDFTTSYADGWKPLREVVRAYAVSLLCDTIHANRIHPEYYRPLILLCIETAAFPEADTILSSILAISHRLPEPLSPRSKLFDRSTSMALATLDHFAQSTGNMAFLYRQLTRLLKDGLLSPTWLSTVDTAQLWSEVVQSISQEDQDVLYAVELVNTVFEIACGYVTVPSTAKSGDTRVSIPSDARKGSGSQIISPNRRAKRGSQNDQSSGPSAKMSNALNNTICSLLATFASICVLDAEASSTLEGNPSRVSMIGQTLFNLTASARSAVLDHRHEGTQEEFKPLERTRLAGTLLIEALLLLKPGRDGNSSGTLKERLGATLRSLGVLLKRLNAHRVPASGLSGRPAAFTEDLAKMLNMFASFCGKGTRQDGFRHLKELTEPLLELLEGHTATMLSERDEIELGKIVLEAAVQSADKSEERVHMEWAESVERKVQDLIAAEEGSDSSSSPDQNSRADTSAYRWDDGLCEWILATPAVEPAKRRVPSQEISSADTSLQSDDRRFETTLEVEVGAHQTPPSSEPSWSPKKMEFAVEIPLARAVSTPLRSETTMEESFGSDLIRDTESPGEDSAYVDTPSGRAVQAPRLRTKSKPLRQKHSDESFNLSSIASHSRTFLSNRARRREAPTRRLKPRGQFAHSTLEDAHEALLSHRAWKENMQPSRLGSAAFTKTRSVSSGRHQLAEQQIEDGEDDGDQDELLGRSSSVGGEPPPRRGAVLREQSTNNLLRPSLTRPTSFDGAVGKQDRKRRRMRESLSSNKNDEHEGDGDEGKDSDPPSRRVRGRSSNGKTPARFSRARQATRDFARGSARIVLDSEDEL